MVTIKNQEFTVKELVGLKRLIDIECDKIAEEVALNHPDISVCAHNHYSTPAFSIWGSSALLDCEEMEDYEGFLFSKGVSISRLEFELIRQELVDLMGGA